jgi:hypothetical protein
MMNVQIPTAGLALSTALASRIYGFNRHTYDLTPTLAANSRKITLAMEVTYIASTGLTKISILLFYRRMAEGAVSTPFRTLVWVSIVSVAGYIIATIIAGFLSCIPLSAFWMQVDLQWAATHTKGVDYHCTNEPAMLLAASTISIAQDFLACGLPLLLFWKLQLPVRQKIALAAIFGVGFFLCITGCLRMYYIHKIFFETYDVTWAAWDAWTWTVVEAHMGIICASAPALKVFMKRYLTTFSITGSASRSWRKRYTRKTGYSEQKPSAYGTASTANLDDAYDRGLEMGSINVTKAVDIETRSMSVGEAERSADSLSDDYRLHSSPESKARTPWLFIDPPTPRRDV